MQVLYEDNHLLIVNKPAGMLSQGDKTGDLTVLDWGKRYLKEKYNKPGAVFLGCVHRLDRPVSGILLLARTSKALSRLNEQLRDKQIKKTYKALVFAKPLPEKATLKHYLLKDKIKNITKAFKNQAPAAKEALLHYELQEIVDGYSMLKINPITGRPHQIRVQLAAIGCPIKGDLKYGAKIANQDQSISLHAYQLEFVHPVKKEKMKITCEIPEGWYR